MDVNTLSFHASKPCLLTLGKLMNCAVEFLKQVITIELTLQILGNESIFKPEVVESLSRDASGMQALDLFDHALIKTLS